MKIYSLDTSEAGNVGLKRTAPRKLPTFSFAFNVLTALSVSCLMISGESLIDVILYSRIDLPLRHALVAFYKAISVLPLYTFGLYYWTPIFIVSLWAGFTHYTKGLLCSCLGVMAFLILLHNFRGFGTHHNVFETAEWIRRSAKTNQPPPEFWDISYIACALLGSIIGIALNAKFKKKNVESAGSDSPSVIKSALLFGTLCMIMGMVEFVIKLIIERNMLYSPLPAMTHGYALVAIGLLTVGAAVYKDYYQESALI